MRWPWNRLAEQIRFLTCAVYELKGTVQYMADLLSTLEFNVTALRTVEDSAIALLQGLKAQLDEALASGDIRRIQAVSDALGTDTADLAAAVVANTPAAPAAPTISPAAGAPPAVPVK